MSLTVEELLLQKDKEIAELISQLELKKSKQAQLMAGSGNRRRKNDLYETPEWAVRSLFSREKFPGGEIWECACGNGNISKVIEELYPCGNSVHTDIDNKYYNWNNYDFINGDLEHRFSHFKPDFIVTNPPYSLFFEFVLKAKQVCKQKFAFFIKTNGLHGIKRYKEIYSDKEFPLARVYLFDRRVNFDGFAVSNTLESCWIVFCKHHVGPPLLFWIDDEDQPVDKNKKYEMEIEELDLFQSDLI